MIEQLFIGISHLAALPTSPKAIEVTKTM